ncbi:hypothetical protein F5Y01DRAFT_317028 [Xylaria sp. FL0043]|nr:hypothetical protein F5Y01DRAFT_317028 [Xylaria sp. FL0043]
MVFCNTLITMPPEVLAGIYCQLPAFRDVFALAATCHQLNAVWCDNATPIYRAIAPSEIVYLELARQLLADQGGTSTNSAVLSPHDVQRMARNARKANNSAHVFGQEIAPRTPSRGLYYTPPQPRLMHPPGLSRTEYARFIRGYYRVCSLLELGPLLWKERYMSFTLRQLYRTSEMVHLNDPLGEEIFPEPPLIMGYSFVKASENRVKLFDELTEYQEEARKRIHGQDVPNLYWISWAPPRMGVGGVGGFLTIWDHCEDELYAQTVGFLRRGNTPRPYDEYMREVVWGDSSDEEEYRRKYRPRRRPQPQQP